MITTSFIHQKGGVGKTTLLINFAAIVAQNKENRIIIFDLSQQSHVKNWIKLRNQNKSLPKIDFLSLNSADLKDTIESYDDEYTHAFIETAGAFSTELIDSIRNSDIAIVPCDSSSGSFDDVQAINTHVLKDSSRNLKAFLIPNQIKTHPHILKSIMEKFNIEVKAYSNMIRVKGFIGDRYCYEKSWETRVLDPKFSSCGRGVVEAYPNSSATEEIVSIYNQIYNK